MTKWYGIHKLQETMAGLQVELARLSADPSDSKPGRNLVKRVELKMADVMAALQWFEYQNKLDVDPDRLEQDCEHFDACHQKPLSHIPGQTYMQGIVMVDRATLPVLVSTLSDDDEAVTESAPDTKASIDVQSDSSPASAEISRNGRWQS